MADRRGAGGEMDSIERCARITTGIQESGGFEHVIVALVRAREAAVVHVLDDGSAWFGVLHDGTEIAALKGLVEGLEVEGEIDVTAEARGFEASGTRTTVRKLLSGVLWTLAEPIDCVAGTMLVRDVAEDPAWLTARYGSDGQVGFLEGAPDLFNRELVRLHDLAPDPVGGGVRLKPSLRAAEVGASYEADLGPEAMDVLKGQREAFEEKFGRPPGPEDPLFFDPTADTPQPIPPEKIAALEAMMAEHGMDQEWFLRRQAEREEEGALRRRGRPVGRNDPCWCGSGKKYKRCHGA
jgi:hypothetical protein